MDDWFRRLAAECRLPSATARCLDDEGFAVIEGFVPMTSLKQLEAAYNRAMCEAEAPDKSVGSTTTRVHDLVNRGPAFDNLYLREPVLAACCHTIRRPFKLSNMLGRTVHPGAGPQGVHADFRRDQDGWPMVGFIVAIDEFRRENGATRFLPASHQLPEDASAQDTETPRDFVSACAPAGSVIIYNGSVLHGHGSNNTDRPRRSIQGAYIRRDATGFDLASRMSRDTADRLGALAKYLLAVEP